MRAVVLTGSIEAPRVAIAEIDRPSDGPARLIVEVRAAGITRTEPRWMTNWKNADGTPRKQPVPLGLEFAGRVRSFGSDVRGFTQGQNVIGMLDPYRGGAMAEFVSADADFVLPMPAGLSHEEASTLPLSGQTAWQALIRHGKLERGQRVLIHGGGGAVGTLAIQIARWIGARILVTASAKDAELCRSLGADEAIDYRHERFEERGSDYDLVFDQIGGDVQERSWTLLKRGGRLITIAGEKADAPDPKRARALGVTALFFVVEQNLDELRKLTYLVVAGAIRPVIGQKFSFSDAANAFDDRTDRVAGKAILTYSGKL